MLSFYEENLCKANLVLGVESYVCASCLNQAPELYILFYYQAQ